MQTWLNNAKFRASYGLLGNNSGVGAYQQREIMAQNNYMFDGSIASGFVYQKMLNKDHHSFLLQQDVNRLLLESTSNLLKHNVDGNNTKQMMDCARRIDDLVFARGSSIKEEL